MGVVVVVGSTIVFCAVGGAVLLAAAASVFMVQMMLPTCTSSPSLAKNWTVPAASAFSSKFALSDSNSQSKSSIATTLPLGTTNRDRVTSVIDSPTLGTLISMIGIY